MPIFLGVLAILVLVAVAAFCVWLLVQSRRPQR